MMEMELRSEGELEARLLADPRWRRGAEWGAPRPGHPEGKVAHHVADVLANLDRQSLPAERRRILRLVALVHDTFKGEVDESRPRVGVNHHAAIARRFLEQYTADPDALEITELHDDAYNAWQIGHRRQDWAKAEARARRLLARLGDRLPLYLAFYRADNATGDKSAEPLVWFERVAGKDLSS